MIYMCIQIQLCHMELIIYSIPLCNYIIYLLVVIFNTPIAILAKCMSCSYAWTANKQMVCFPMTGVV